MNLTPLDPWIRSKIGPAEAVLGRAELEAWQLKKLNETVALVRARSPFYRQHLAGGVESLGSLEEVNRLPFTTPDNIRGNPLRFVCVPQSDIHRIVTLQTSGTTGEPKRIFFTAADQELTVDFFGIGMSVFTQPGEKVLILLPCQTPGGVGDLLRQGLARLDRIPLPYGPVRDPLHALEMMRAQKPHCVVGSPTQVLGLARRWKAGDPPPRSVLLSTDYVPAAIVRALEDAWGCAVYNHYGTTEMGLGGGVECEAHHGYHLREADLYFEIVDPVSGETLPDGEYGEVVFTTLTRRGMPLIRYRMGDRSRFITQRCPCGTSLRCLETVRGRYSGFIPAAGEILSLPDFDEAIFAVAGLLNFSVTVTGTQDEPALLVDAQMLTAADAALQIQAALETIPAARNLKTTIRCHYAPEEAGSLLKRVIIDRRSA